jgi:hypothetical protein
MAKLKAPPVAAASASRYESCSDEDDTLSPRILEKKFNSAGRDKKPKAKPHSNALVIPSSDDDSGDDDDDDAIPGPSGMSAKKPTSSYKNESSEKQAARIAIDAEKQAARIAIDALVHIKKGTDKAAAKIIYKNLLDRSRGDDPFIAWCLDTFTEINHYLRIKKKPPLPFPNGDVITLIFDRMLNDNQPSKPVAEGASKRNQGSRGCALYPGPLKWIDTITIKEELFPQGTIIDTRNFPLGILVHSMGSIVQEHIAGDNFLQSPNAWKNIVEPKFMKVCSSRNLGFDPLLFLYKGGFSGMLRDRFKAYEGKKNYYGCLKRTEKKRKNT